MRQIKNWLRISILQQRFIDLFILIIEMVVANNIKTDLVLDKYSTETRKIVFKVIKFKCKITKIGVKFV